MKILYITNEKLSGSSYGGIRTYFEICGKTLEKNGHEVHIISINEYEKYGDLVDRGLIKHFRPYSINHWLLRVARLFRFSFTLERFMYAWRLHREYQKLNIGFDIVEAADWFGLGIFFINRNGTPLVVSLHLCFAQMNLINGDTWRPDNFVAGLLEKYVVYHARFVKASSRHSLAAYDSKYISNLKVIINPFDFDIWQDISPVGSSEKVVLFVGRVEKIKGIEILLSAFRIIQERYSDARLVVVGKVDTEYKNFLIQKFIAKKIDEKMVEFVGMIEHEELPKYFSLARVVVVPSIFETFSYVGQEALACGRPLVISNNSGLADVVEKNILGTVLEDLLTETLVNAIELYLKNIQIAQEVGERGKKYSRELFNAKSLVGEMEISIFSRLIK